MTAHDQQLIAALLGSRICHDLISPIGAISNGVELLQMSGAASSPELELISESVDNANARIRFFRVAFGMASADQTLGASEIRDTLRDMTRGSRLTIDWADDGDRPRSEVKAVFLMLQCLESAMPWGGRVVVEREGDAWIVTARSERMKIDPDLWNSLRGQAPAREISPAEVQFLLLPAFLADQGRKLDLAMAEGVIEARM